MVTTLQLVAWHDTCLLLINLPETVRKVLVYFSPLTFQSKVYPLLNLKPSEFQNLQALSFESSLCVFCHLHDKKSYNTLNKSHIELIHIT